MSDIVKSNEQNMVALEAKFGKGRQHYDPHSGVFFIEGKKVTEDEKRASIGWPPKFNPELRPLAWGPKGISWWSKGDDGEEILTPLTEAEEKAFECDQRNCLLCELGVPDIHKATASARRLREG